jgi:hypothetical protein
MNIITRCAAALAAMVFCAPAMAGGPGSIYWITEPMDCGVGWGAPMISTYVAYCPMGGVFVSICPGAPAPGLPYGYYTFSNGLWEAGAPVTIVGVSATHVLSNAASSGHFVIGSAHNADGPDVFVTGGGQGTTQTTKILANPFPQGGDAPGAHIDVYAHCDSGTHWMLLEIDYVPR